MLFCLCSFLLHSLIFFLCNFPVFLCFVAVNKRRPNPTWMDEWMDGWMNGWLVAWLAEYTQHLTPSLNTTPPSAAAGHYCSGNMLNYSITSSLHSLQDARSLLKITERVCLCVNVCVSLYWWRVLMKGLQYVPVCVRVCCKLLVMTYIRLPACVLTRFTQDYEKTEFDFKLNS